MSRSTDASKATLTPVTAARRHRAQVFTVTSLAAFMSSLDLSIVNVAFPSMAKTFPTDSRAALAWVITSYAIVFGSLMVSAGRTADRLGRRRVFFTGIAIFATGSALCATAPVLAMLLVGRATQAIGAALLVPASLSLLLEAFTENSRSQVVSLWSAVGGLAVATGPSLGAALIEVAGWRSAFYINVPIGLLAWAWGRRILRRDSDRTRDSATGADYLGVALITVCLASLVFAVSEGPTFGWTGWPVSGFVVAGISGVLFIRRCRWHPAPTLDLRLFQDRSFSVANTAMVLYAMAFFAILLGNILFLTGRWHYSILQAGLAMTPGPLVVAAVAGPAGRLARLVGFRPVLVCGFAVLAGAFLWLHQVINNQPQYLSSWLPGSIVGGIGIGLTYPVLAAASVARLPQSAFALGSAVMQTARQIGGAIGVAVVVAILGSASGPTVTAVPPISAFQAVWAFGAVMSVGALLLSTVLSTTRQPPLIASRTSVEEPMLTVIEPRPRMITAERDPAR